MKIIITVIAILVSVVIYVQERGVYGSDASRKSAFVRAATRLRFWKNPFWTKAEKQQIIDEIAWAREEAQMARREVFGEVYSG